MSDGAPSYIRRTHPDPEGAVVTVTESPRGREADVHPGPSSARTRLEARLEDPEVASSLDALLEHADLLAVILESLDGFLRRSETIGDSAFAGIAELRATVMENEAVKGMAASGVTTQDLVDAGISLASALPKAAPGMVDVVNRGVIDRVLASELVSDDAVTQIEVVARGLVAGSNDFETNPVPVSGPLSLAKALRDPDIQRALSYGATVARSIGRELAQPRPAAPGTPAGGTSPSSSSRPTPAQRGEH